ncbi:hypothetical protein ACPBEH_02605 [Latilactobacillus sp. 5-91]|uniref:hypothetical protein n=1 Tax=Latilactobacillus sp. 5-91 TaxID=3410924 RepID=UPI003C74C331
MQAINNKLDSAYLKIDGMLALLNYMQQDFEERLKHSIDPKKQISDILNTGYGHEVAIGNASSGISGLTEDLRELQELTNEANREILQANHTLRGVENGTTQNVQ